MIGLIAPLLFAGLAVWTFRAERFYRAHPDAVPRSTSWPRFWAICALIVAVVALATGAI